MSLSILVLAVYMIYLTSLAMIPKKIEIINISLYDPRSQIDEVKQDLLMRQALGWKRTQFVVAVVISVLANMVVLEYSYSGKPPRLFFRMIPMHRM